MEASEYIKEHFKGTQKGKIFSIPDRGRTDLAVMFNDLGYKVGVEIGTEYGKFASVLCEKNPGLKLYCIDPYVTFENGQGYKDLRQKQFESIYTKAQARLKPYNAEIIRKYSMDAVADFKDNSLDFVYIDGNHRLDFVVQDLIYWTPKVKPGGIVAGHDYIKLARQCYSHIPYAVSAYVEAYFINKYYVLDNKDKKRTTEENRRYDRIKSWFFVKGDDSNV